MMTNAASLKNFFKYYIAFVAEDEKFLSRPSQPGMAAQSYMEVFMRVCSKSLSASARECGAQKNLIINLLFLPIRYNDSNLHPALILSKIYQHILYQQ